MSTKIKRLSALLISCAMIVSALAGCAGNDNGSTSSGVSSTSSTDSSTVSSGTTPEENTTKAANAARDKVNVRFSQFANNTDDAEGMKNDPIKKYIEETVNITLEYDTGTEGYDDRMQTELAVGNAPDLFPTWGESEKIKKWVDEEAVTDIGSIITAEPDRYPTLNKIISTPEYKAYNKLYLGDENATYAIYSISSLAYPQFNGVPAYNSAILKELNDGKIPETVDEFVAFTKAAGAAGYSGWWPYNVKLTNWGELDKTIASPMGTTILAPFDKAWQGFVPEGTLGTDSEKWTLATTSEKSKEAVKVLADMYANNALHQGVGILTDDDDGYSQFADGRIASFSYGYGYYTQFHKLYMGVWKEAHADAELSDVTLGYALQDDGNWSHSYDTGTWVGAHYFIPTSCDYPDRVLDLVEYLATNEGQNTLFRGIEGLTYTMDGDNVVYNIDEFVNINKSYGYANPDRCRYMWFSYLFSGCEMRVDLENNDWWESVTAPYDNTVEWATAEDKEVYDYALEQISKSVDNVYVKLPAYYTFVALPAEMSDIRTSLKEITNRYLSAMVGGQMDIDANWSKYQAEYEAAGAAQIEEALNAAVAEARSTYGG